VIFDRNEVLNKTTQVFKNTTSGYTPNSVWEMVEMS